MKFLCVRCDEAMKLERVEGPEEGSLGVVFSCAACGNQVAMLTNPWETQLVRALDVRIGGRPSRVEPMEFVRNMLAPAGEAGADGASPGSAPSRCPFSAVANLAADPALGQSGHRAAGKSDAGGRAPDPHPEIGEAAPPGCPGAESPEGRMSWSPEAKRRLERIPDFIRPTARQGIERIAAQRGYQRITEDIMDEVRSALGL